MNKVAHYLQEHLLGEVSTSTDARKYFATDSSVFAVIPMMVVYPKNENDVRKIARFTWQLAERGRVIPITSRGKGTDQAGAALGKGLMVVFPAHMHKIIEYDGRSGNVVVEPGVVFGKLQQTLHTHGRFLPPYPASVEYSTLGGAIANNTSGEKTVKYGCMRDYVHGLRVVLANGEVIETKRLSKRELNKKMGLSSFEGEVYRNLDKLIEDNKALIDKIGLGVTKNSAGYAIGDVKQKSSFDLTPLIVGSQGTLAIVTEATLGTEAYNPHTSLIAAFFDDLGAAQKAILELKKLPEKPSALEMVDENLLKFVHANNPNQLKGVVSEPFHKLIMLIEFDSGNERTRKKMAKKAIKILGKYNAEHQLETKDDAKERLWKIRRSSSAVLSHSDGDKKALPIVDDGVVPLNRLKEYIEGLHDIFHRHKLKVALWGQAGSANIHVQPFLDLAQVGDRQKIFKIMDECYSLMISLGGSTSGANNDGRLRAPYLPKLYGEKTYELFRQVKAIFDPYGTLNPGVKIDVTADDIKPLLRNEYSLSHLYDHLPYS